MSVLCPICSGFDIDVQGLYRGSHPIFVGLKRVLCRTCGMVFADPMPQDSDLDQYNANYFTAAHGAKHTSSTAVAFFSGIAGLRCSHIIRYILANDIQVSRLLEFGPGTGYFAERWLKRFPDTEYFGCETDTSCHDLLQKLGVKLISDYPRNKAILSVDMVVMSHVLEHVSKPYEFMMDATHNLRSGGALFIEVPCQDYEHKSIDEPHLLFFDKKPMNSLLTRCGFENIQVTYHGQAIERLKSPFIFHSKMRTLRDKLIRQGVVRPFARRKTGLEALADPLERAVISPFKAHCESQKPAWWLRAVATMRRN